MAKISISSLSKVIDIYHKFRNRPKDSHGRPGGLIELPGSARPLIVGDLHAKLENLLAILNHEKNLSALKSGRLTLVILGDSVHSDETGQFMEMQSSLETLECVLELILAYGRKVIYIRGNHDTFDNRLVKSAIAQGEHLRQYILEKRGTKYTDLVQEFFENLPLVVKSDKYLILHGGPVRGGLEREDVINIRDNADNYHQILWNRVHEFRGNPSLKEYAEADIRDMQRRLKLPPESYFIVGHNPLWNTGNRSGVWADVLGIKNHYILYSGHNTRAPYLLIERGDLTVKFAKEPEAEVFYA